MINRIGSYLTDIGQMHDSIKVVKNTDFSPAYTVGNIARCLLTANGYAELGTVPSEKGEVVNGNEVFISAAIPVMEPVTTQPPQTFIPVEIPVGILIQYDGNGKGSVSIGTRPEKVKHPAFLSFMRRLTY